MKCREGRVELQGRCKEGFSQSHGSSEPRRAWLGHRIWVFMCYPDETLGVGCPKEGDTTEGKFQRGAQLYAVASIPRGGQEQGRCSDLKGMAGQHAAASTHPPEIGDKLIGNRSCVHFHLKK